VGKPPNVQYYGTLVLRVFLWTSDIKEVELPSKATKSVLRQWVSPSTENKNTTFGREPKEKEFNRKKTQGPL
jgi:hypothetical protein